MKTSISFSGIDGAGKSTQIENFINLLGLKNCVIYRLKFGYTPGIEFLKNLFIYFRRSPIRSKEFTKEKNFSRDLARNSSKLLFYLSICDYVIFLYFIYFKNLFYKKVLIFDRFHLDNKFDIAQKFGVSNKLNLFIFLLKFLPSTQFGFILLISPDTSLERSEAKKDKYAEDRKTLVKKYEFYINSNCSVIDASGPKNIVFKKIMGKISILGNTPLSDGIVVMNYLKSDTANGNYYIIDDLEDLRRIPFYKHRFNRRMQFKKFKKLFPELWYHNNFNKLITLRTFTAIIFFSIYLLNLISRKRKNNTTIIECIKSGRSAEIYFTSDEKVISVRKNCIRDFKKEKKLRGALKHIPQAEIISVDTEYMIESLHYGIPVNRLRNNGIARSKIDIIINETLRSRIVNEVDFIETFEGTLENLLQNSLHLEIKETLHSLKSHLKRIKFKRINKQMNICISHNDLHDGNILLVHGDQLIIVDFEDIGEAMVYYDKYVQKYKMRTKNGIHEFLSNYSPENEDMVFQILWSELKFRLNEIKKSCKKNNKAAMQTLCAIEYFLANK